MLLSHPWLPPSLCATPAFAAEPDWSQVAQALGKSGGVQAGGVYRVGFPRTDLKVSLDGVALRTGFAFGGWVAFQPMGGEAMVMGDLVLTQDEVAPVMRKLEEGGIEISALHNHLLRAEPMTLYMHIQGHGDPVKLAGAIHAGLALSKTPFAPPPGTSTPANIDMIGIDRIMGYLGQDSGGIYQFGIPRAQPVTDQGMALPGAMGAAIAINFQPTGFDTAAITGDFVLLGTEVNPVIRALQANGIEITALHSHMLDEQPRVFFMHFWANDDARKLATGLRAALDKVDVKKGQARQLLYRTVPGGGNEALRRYWRPWSACCSAAPSWAADPAPLVLEAKIPLGAVSGRIDHFAFDPDRQLLFVAELGNDSVGVVDLKKRKVVHRIAGLSEPQGIAYHAATSTLYVANAGDGSVRLFQGPDFAPPAASSSATTPTTSASIRGATASSSATARGPWR